MNQLQRAMHNIGADIEDQEFIQAAGREAVQAAIAHDDAKSDFARQLEEEKRQRDLDAALADAVEVVARQRGRLGRRVCSVYDAKTVRQIHELLRAMGADSVSESDPSFQ